LISVLKCAVMSKKKSSKKSSDAVKEIAPMNEDLKKWVKEAEKEGILTQKIEDIADKEEKKLGKCEICGEKSAKSVCIKCNRSVCLSCYFKMIGVCKDCVDRETVDKWLEKHPDWEKILGVEWVD
jgi:hypothetical protein